MSHSLGAAAVAEARTQGPVAVTLWVWVRGLTNAPGVWETTETELTGQPLCVEQCWFICFLYTVDLSCVDL